MQKCKFIFCFSNHSLSPQAPIKKKDGKIDIFSSHTWKRDYRICNEGTFLMHCEAQGVDKAILGLYHISLWSRTLWGSLAL